MIVVLPNGGVVVLDGFKSALQLETPPSLCYRGKPSFPDEIQTSAGSEFGVTPAGEAYASIQLLVRGGTSAYSDDLGFGLSRNDIVGVGADANSLAIETNQVSAARVNATSAFTPVKPGNGYGKGGRFDKNDGSDDGDATSQQKSDGNGSSADSCRRRVIWLLQVPTQARSIKPAFPPA